VACAFEVVTDEQLIAIVAGQQLSEPVSFHGVDGDFLAVVAKVREELDTPVPELYDEA
jgi:hypothetical protein